MEKETLVIKSTEKLSEVFKDSSNKAVTERRPKGYVEIYERTIDGDKQLVGKCNLVVLQGRELIGQILTDTNNENTVVKFNERIYWFGLGIGGVSGGDPFSPNPPLSTDTDLTSEVPFGIDSVNCTDLYLGKYYKHNLDKVEFEIDGENDDAYLITKITINIGIEDAQNSPEYLISEAGLFTCNSNSPGQTREEPFSQYHMFARITFPSIVKTNTRELVFLWYIYT